MRSSFQTYQIFNKEVADLIGFFGDTCVVSQSFPLSFRKNVQINNPISKIIQNYRADL